MCGYKPCFIELEAYKYRTMTEMVTAIFDKIDAQIDDNEPFSIISHSMGAMSLLKILLDKEYFQKRSFETYQQISQSRLVFIQVPVLVKRPVLNFMRFLRIFAAPILFLHRYLITSWLNPLLIVIKKLFFKSPKSIKTPVDFITNVILMHNSAWGTPVKELWRLVDFYSQWDDYCYENLNLTDTRTEQIVNSSFKDTAFNVEFTNRYFFTTGDPDQFCDDSLTRVLINKIGATELPLAMGFHSPHHMPWHQEELFSIIR